MTHNAGAMSQDLGELFCGESQIAHAVNLAPFPDPKRVRLEGKVSDEVAQLRDLMMLQQHSISMMARHC